MSSGDKGSDHLPKDLAKSAVTLSGRKATNGSIYSTVRRAQSDDLKLKHLRSGGTESQWDRGSSVGRESFDFAAELRDPVSRILKAAAS